MCSEKQTTKQEMSKPAHRPSTPTPVSSQQTELPNTEPTANTAILKPQGTIPNMPTHNVFRVRMHGQKEQPKTTTPTNINDEILRRLEHEKKEHQVFRDIVEQRFSRLEKQNEEERARSHKQMLQFTEELNAERAKSARLAEELAQDFPRAGASLYGQDLAERDQTRKRKRTDQEQQQLDAKQIPPTQENDEQYILFDLHHPKFQEVLNRHPQPTMVFHSHDTNPLTAKNPLTRLSFADFQFGALHATACIKMFMDENGLSFTRDANHAQNASQSHDTSQLPASKTTTQWKCVYCSQVYANKFNMEKHVALRNEQKGCWTTDFKKPKVCLACKFMTTNKKSWNEHICKRAPNDTPSVGGPKNDS